MFSIKKAIRLGLFGLVCAALLVGILYGGDIFSALNKGEFKDNVIDNKPTMIVVFDEEQINSNSYQDLSKVLAYAGSTYEEELSISNVSIHSEEVEAIQQKFNVSLKKLPLLIILSKEGYAVGVYKGTMPADKIKFDLEQILN